jgi:hypothetical protein
MNESTLEKISGGQSVKFERVSPGMEMNQNFGLGV